MGSSEKPPERFQLVRVPASGLMNSTCCRRHRCPLTGRNTLPLWRERAPRRTRPRFRQCRRSELRRRCLHRQRTWSGCHGHKWSHPGNRLRHNGRLVHNGVISGIAAGKLRPDRDVVCAEMRPENRMSGTRSTVMVQEAERLGLARVVAVMVAVPAPVAVTTPSCTVATASLLEDQVTVWSVRVQG